MNQSMKMILAACWVALGNTPSLLSQVRCSFGEEIESTASKSKQTHQLLSINNRIDYLPRKLPRLFQDTKNMKNIFRLASLSCLVSFSLFADSVVAQQQGNNGAEKPRTIARLVWQDTAEQTLRWGDLQRTGNEWKLAAANVEGVPKLDPETQNYVQMEPIANALIAGIHDSEKGSIGSGWIALDSGVELEAHGDHFHPKFTKLPKVVHTQVNQEQGNPAHVYGYNNRIYIANDAKNGFTIVTPPKASNGAWKSEFFSGGGNHITLAAAADRWCYATWADREGDNVGRVDVVATTSVNTTATRSFRLPSGGLHGATFNSGKVFFAPSDGICVVAGDGSDVTAESIQHISLGTDPKSDRPNRTGAFTNLRSWVLFNYGSGDQAKVGMIDASKAKVQLLELPVPAGEGLSLSTPECFTAANGKDYAWVVHHRRNSDQVERLTAIDLDPNGDKNFSDAAVVKTLELGPSKIEGHSGFHEIAILPNRRAACITNPGDGTMWIVSIANLEVLAKLAPGGSPTRVVAFGG
jgi:hypothetical protein